jgi:hypothetical protein
MKGDHVAGLARRQQRSSKHTVLVKVTPAMIGLTRVDSRVAYYTHINKGRDYRSKAMRQAAE